jgi:aspartate--ammonia ligase
MRSTQRAIDPSYRPVLDIYETQVAVKTIKDLFQARLAETLNLQRVTAPLFVAADSGINDALNGVERPISFDAPALGERRLEIVQSLAKWKRYTLAQLGMKPGQGLYTDMNALRRDEELDELHSIYVDQWDWERVMKPEERTLVHLFQTVRKIYQALVSVEVEIGSKFPAVKPFLSSDITFIQAQTLEDQYPKLSPSEREDRTAREHGAVFVVGIGRDLASGAPHDGRAPDYDDWITPTEDGHGLNGDLIVWNPILGRAFEVSSMGIRVDPRSLRAQLAIRNCSDWSERLFHRQLLAGELPLTIGGGIGQSRLCMLLLQKAHIGEVQASLWPPEMVRDCREKGIPLLSH